MASTGMASRPVLAPRWPAVAALGVAVLAAALVILEVLGDASRAFVVALVGYVLGALVVTVLVQVHRNARNRAQRSAWYSPNWGLDRLAAIALAVGLLSAAWHAFVLATELAKR